MKNLALILGLMMTFSAHGADRVTEVLCKGSFKQGILTKNIVVAIQTDTTTAARIAKFSSEIEGLGSGEITNIQRPPQKWAEWNYTNLDYKAKGFLLSLPVDKVGLEESPFLKIKELESNKDLTGFTCDVFVNPLVGGR